MHKIRAGLHSAVNMKYVRTATSHLPFRLYSLGAQQKPQCIAHCKTTGFLASVALSSTLSPVGGLKTCFNWRLSLVLAHSHRDRRKNVLLEDSELLWKVGSQDVTVVRSLTR